MNLTIMLVMTTIFTSKIEALPPTSDTKMIDAWLIFSLLIPFAAVVIQTAIECYRYSHNVMLQSANAMISTLSTTHTTNRESCDLFVKLKFVPSRDEEEDVQRGKSQTVAKILARTGGHHHHPLHHHPNRNHPNHLHSRSNCPHFSEQQLLPGISLISVSLYTTISVLFYIEAL